MISSVKVQGGTLNLDIVLLWIDNIGVPELINYLEAQSHFYSLAPDALEEFEKEHEQDATQMKLISGLRAFRKAFTPEKP